ncbi:MAG: outer membrane beta-barrel protein [Hyphomicrobium sp.]|uniref:outer membrane protein n=1 Tax=Hyphomicrobium sp. TaxID=82 RepID=UPI00132826C5|nr:outer membrane beta-barrel protein [Hyphomicrobium sp.]KAB2941395.1 MAG: porin family protein [Hyphomicrobium sp.]MBZ0212046.1 outer membrane beta-barrel protein [Hyphomicrobium sp.]
MKLKSSGRGGVKSLAVVAVAFAVGVPASASAHEWFRIPSLSYATDAELPPLVRTGFILSPDFNISDEVNLGGTGGALLEDTEGFSIGAKVGYDKQIGDVVLGVVTDGFYSFADGGGRGAGAGKFESELQYYGTVRGRLGYALGRLMVYGTAGYAYGELEVTDITTGASDSEMLSGWTYGGGLEYVWNGDITLHAGYRRIDFDDQTFSVLPGVQNSLSPEMDVFDFGLVRRY